MKIGIFTHRPELKTHKRLIQIGQELGHDISVIDSRRCYLSLTCDGPKIHDEKRLMQFDFDAIIPRNVFKGLSVLRQFEAMGVYILNPLRGHALCGNKLHLLQVLSRHNIGLPITSYAQANIATEELIRSVGGAPLIIKLITASHLGKSVGQGRGVVIADSHQSARSMIEALRAEQANFLVQEYIAESAGKDIRSFVVGNQVVAAMERHAQSGEFRSNLHRGGSPALIKLSPEEEAISLKAMKVAGLNVAGVDIIRSKRGPLVLEINNCPGITIIEQLTHVNVSRLIIEYIEVEVKKRVKTAVLA